MEKTERPSFLTSYFEALAASARARGVGAIVPYKLFLCAVAGSAGAYFLPAIFWDDAKWEVSTAVFAGLLTFNALIIAVTWSAFANAFEIIASGPFGTYLKSQNLLQRYFVSIGYINIVQGLAAVASAVTLLSVLLTFPYAIVDRIIVGTSLTGTIYALYQAAQANQLMADLIWAKALFDERH